MAAQPAELSEMASDLGAQNEVLRLLIKELNAALLEKDLAHKQTQRESESLQVQVQALATALEIESKERQKTTQENHQLRDQAKEQITYSTSIVSEALAEICRLKAEIDAHKSQSAAMHSAISMLFQISSSTQETTPEIPPQEPQTPPASTVLPAGSTSQLSFS